MIFKAEKLICHAKYYKFHLTWGSHFEMHNSFFVYTVDGSLKCGLIFSPISKKWVNIQRLNFTFLNFSLHFLWVAIIIPPPPLKVEI